MLVLPACAQELTTQQVLDKVISTYSTLKAGHMIAEEETTYQTPVLEQRSRIPNSPSATAGTIWRCLGSKVSTASLTHDGDKDQGAQTANTDLHDALEGIPLYEFLALAKKGAESRDRQARGFQAGR